MLHPDNIDWGDIPVYWFGAGHIVGKDAHRRLMPCDDNPGGDLAVDPGEVVQEPAELACANCGPAGTS